MKKLLPFATLLTLAAGLLAGCASEETYDEEDVPETSSQFETADQGAENAGGGASAAGQTDSATEE